MREGACDIWSTPADAIAITTNGVVRRDGACVMGRGLAAQARKHCPRIEFVLGAAILGAQRWAKENRVFPDRAPGCPLGIPSKVYGVALVAGNVPHDLGRWSGPAGQCDIVSFPVKWRWDEKADLELIRVSAALLRDLVARRGWRKVLLGRPGCSNGRLNWDDVRPVIAPLLPDQVVVVTLPEAA